ncbi:MAG: hypothetical protein ACF8Q5_07470 [Phycisphaerales bacterium JB040]
MRHARLGFPARAACLLGALAATLAAGLAMPDAAERHADSPETALHFWAGEWDCYSVSDGRLSGRNVLELRVNGKVLHEAWASEGQDYIGESWNHYDASARVWRQLWVDQQGNVFSGAADASDEQRSPGDGLLFEGEQIKPDGDVTQIRMHVRPVAEGWVRQTGTQLGDNGEWTPRYDLVYVPEGEPFDPAKLKAPNN